jgi:hypothetical protein
LSRWRHSSTTTPRERRVAGPVLEHVERRLDRLLVVGGDLEHVDRLVEGRVRVDVGAELHAGVLEEIDELLPLEAARAVEEHVLEEVRDAALVLLLEHGARVDDEPQLGAVRRLDVPPDVVGEPVVELADPDGRVGRDRIVRGERLGGCRFSGLLRAGRRREGRQDGQNQKARNR